ncbi:MobA/MobL family protein, partial [Acinetobacter guillouiae]
VPSRLEDQISKVEDELRLTVSEERELLAELANIDREEEQLQAQQVQQIDNAYEDFIHCQNTYAENANQFYIIHINANSKNAELEK